MKALHIIAFILLVVGGLNLGLAALGYNVIDMLLGAGSAASKVFDILVGLSAIYFAATHKGDCKTCEVSATA